MSTKPNIQTLIEARQRMVGERYAAAVELAKPYKRGESERLKQMVIETQQVIDAIDCAIEEANKSEPQYQMFVAG